MPRVLSLHTGRIQPLATHPQTLTAINKTPVEGPIALTPEGLAGDRQADLRRHGGPFKALCAYASEYYPDWRAAGERPMPPGSFGENLVLQGLTDDQVCLGDVYTLGGARVQVTGPRGPCKTLARHWESNSIHLEAKRQTRTGFYLRVLDRTTLEAPLDIERVERPLPQWDLPRFWQVIERKETAPAPEIDALLALDALDPDWHPRLEKLPRLS